MKTLKSMFLSLNIAILLNFMFATVSKAELLSFGLVPVIGYEQVTALLPTRHTKSRLFYGGIATIGVPLISGELEYLLATDTEKFSDPTLTIKDTVHRARLGLRSSFHLTPLLSLFARAGAQASRNKLQITDAGGNISTSSNAWKFAPYAGAGLKLRVSTKFALLADVVVVFGNFPSMANNTYQTSAGFAIFLP